jgi:DNA replicative helicase MCM subunit Mcm2 (Cdc46/Mcm family)
LVLIGGVGQDSDGHKTRGDSHLLLVGDPGTAKSQFLRYAALVCPRTVFTTGIGSTSAGLTCTAVKDSGEWQLEAGALVLADMGVCCIDEFASIKEADKTAIHEAMEQQTISVAKAGLVCKLNTRCAVLAATNPKGKYDVNVGIEVNTALGTPLLSRFDLILILLDTPNSDWDRDVSTFILEKELYECALENKNESEGAFDLPMMQAYLAEVKTIIPEMTSEAAQTLKKYYQVQRASDHRNAARTTIRLLESLVRLAQAHARLMFRHKVILQDAIVSIILVEASMMSAALAGVHSTLHAGFPDDPKDLYRMQEFRILEKLELLEFVSTYEESEATDLNFASINSSPPEPVQVDPEQSQPEPFKEAEPTSAIHMHQSPKQKPADGMNLLLSPAESFVSWVDSQDVDLEAMAGEIQKPTQDHLLELGILGDSGAPNPKESTKRKDIESFDLFGESQSSFTPPLSKFGLSGFSYKKR